MCDLGSNLNISQELIMRVEEFTCYIYGYREKNINNVHFKMFKRKQAREHKVIDLSTLPPCKEVLSYLTKSKLGFIFMENFFGFATRLP